MVPDLPKWHRFDRIAELAEPFIIARRGASAERAAPLLPELSSTDVRALFEQDDREALQALLPRAVLDYALERGLYARRR